jgi:enoyl-[acyl-carrier protein] reductase I
MGFLSGKKVLIVGLVSNRSIAYGIAQAMHREGAELAFTYQVDKLKDRVTDLAANFDSKIILPCDVGFDEQIDSVFVELGKHWDGLDVIVHSVAYAPADQLEGDYTSNLTREGFRVALDVSAYSLGALAKAGMGMMKGRNGSIITLSYLGAEQAVPSYNVMGVAKAALEANVRYLAASLGPIGTRVNAVSAGPIRTLAASGIGGFRDILKYNEQVAPLRKNITIEEVGNAAAFLSSDLASGITGEVLHVDAGFNIVAFPEPGVTV